MGDEQSQSWLSKHASHVVNTVFFGTGLYFWPKSISYMVDRLQSGQMDGSINEHFWITCGYATLPALIGLGTAFILDPLTQFSAGHPHGRLTREHYAHARKLRTEWKRKHLPPRNERDTIRAGQSFFGWLARHSFCMAGLQTKKAGENYETLGRERQDPALLAEAAFWHSGERYDDSMLCLRDSYDLLAEKNVKPTLFTKTGTAIMQTLFRPYLRLYPRPSSHLLAASISALTNPERAWQHTGIAKDLAIAVDAPNKLETAVFHAMISHSLNAETAPDDWRTVADLAYQLPLWERAGETRNIVRTHGGSPFLSTTLLFKSSPNLDDLLSEAKTTTLVKHLVGDTADVPQTLHVSDTPDEDGNYLYLMRYLPGEPLLAKLEQGDTSNLEDVVSLLATIHATFPQEQSRKGRVSIPRKLKSKLLAEEYGISRALAKRVIHNYRPVYDALTDEKTAWGYNKDAHPENWLVSEERIGIIDCENNNLVPLQFDLANLLNYDDYITTAQKRELVQHYLSTLDQQGLSPDPDHFFLGYWNAVIQRMIDLSSAWSSPLRKSLHDKRPRAIQNAIDAIDIIKQDHLDYFGKHERKYVTLQSALHDIKQLFTQQHF